MAGSINSVTLVGNVGAAPKMRATRNGEEVANFSVATSHSWKDSSGRKQEETTWHQIVCFGKTAEIVGQFLTKGRLVAVQGSISIREYQDDAGNTKTSYQIKAQSVQLLGGRGEAMPGELDVAGIERTHSSAVHAEAAAAFAAMGPSDLDDDVPF